MPKLIFIDWRPHNGRAKNLAGDLGATLYLAPRTLRARINAPLRYLYLAVRTCRILWTANPDVVIASTPPSFCPLVVFLYSWVSRCRYIIDAHHGATYGPWLHLPFGIRLNRLIMNRATATLVHNECIHELVARQGIKSMVVETKAPRIDAPAPNASAPFTVLVPCSFDADEPIPVIYEAARRLPEVRFCLTGDTSRLSRPLLASAPSNVALPGFLSQAEYERVLAGVHAVVVLSTDDYPLRPRGASEAIGATKPLIVSRNGATEAQLYKGTVLVGNRSDEVSQAILAIAGDYDRYVREITELREERARQYEVDIRALNAVIADATQR
jgi:glycosyltransferase involved in cell wall biosynthesis